MNFLVYRMGYFWWYLCVKITIMADWADKLEDLSVLTQ